MKNLLPRIRLGLFTLIFLIFLFAGLLLMTSFGEIVIKLVPNEFHKKIFQNVYQEENLIDKPSTLEKEIKLIKELNILGTKTGVCFEFKAGGMTAGQKKNADIGITIADVTIIGNNQQSYALKEVEVTKTTKKTTLICQQLGRAYSSTSDKGIMLLIKPKQPFTPIRVFWVSVKDMFEIQPLR